MSYMVIPALLHCLHSKYQIRSAMRRIIERKVTVVTTTTWTIFWQDAPPPSSSEADPAQETLPNTDALPAAQASSANEIKEVVPPETKT